MATARERDLAAIEGILLTWADQIADLQAKARTAAVERRRTLRAQIAELAQRRWACAVQLEDKRGASTAALREMRLGAERSSKEFRRLYLATVSRFPT